MLLQILSFEKKDEKNNLKSRDRVVTLGFHCLNFLNFNITFSGGITTELLEAMEARLEYGIYNFINYPPSYTLGANVNGF